MAQDSNYIYLFLKDFRSMTHINFPTTDFFDILIHYFHSAKTEDELRERMRNFIKRSYDVKMEGPIDVHYDMAKTTSNYIICLLPLLNFLTDIIHRSPEIKVRLFRE